MIQPTTPLAGVEAWSENKACSLLLFATARLAPGGAMVCPLTSL